MVGVIVDADGVGAGQDRVTLLRAEEVVLRAEALGIVDVESAPDAGGDVSVPGRLVVRLSGVEVDVGVGETPGQRRRDRGLGRGRADHTLRTSAAPVRTVDRDAERVVPAA